MQKLNISIIAAIGQNRELGKDNKLLWHLPEDLARFKKITTGHPVIIGRKTFESLGRPLPERLNIVITRDKNYRPQGVITANSLEEALEAAQKKDNNIFIIGGGQLYQQTINIADKLYLTVVEGQFEADTFFPDYSRFKRVVFEEAKEYKGLKYKFLELERS